MNLREQFCKEVGIDLSDYEYVGKFPYYKKGGKTSYVSRGEGWKRYSEWLEQRNKEQVEVFRFVLEQVDWEDQKFSVRVVAKNKIEEQLKK